MSMAFGSAQAETIKCPEQTPANEGLIVVNNTNFSDDADMCVEGEFRSLNIAATDEFQVATSSKALTNKDGVSVTPLKFRRLKSDPGYVQVIVITQKDNKLVPYSYTLTSNKSKD